jgi:Glycosyl transferase family 2
MPESLQSFQGGCTRGIERLVSIVIPAYNSAAFIHECLNSIFSQTFGDFEVIVVNDGSPDTDCFERAIQGYRDRILYLKQENHGPSAARNAGIRVAKGQYLAFLDADDIWLPPYLAEQVNFLEGHPHIEVSIADAVWFGGPQGEVTWRMLKRGGPGILDFARILKREGGQSPSASVARRQRVIEVGMFDEELRLAEDFNLLARICFPDRAAGYLGRVLVRRRRHPGSLTADSRDRKWQAGELKALRRLGEALPLTAAQRALLADETAAAGAALALSDAYYHLTEDNVEKGASFLRQANDYYHDFRLSLAVTGLRIFPRWTVRYLNHRCSRTGRSEGPLRFRSG